MMAHTPYNNNLFNNNPPSLKYNVVFKVMFPLICSLWSSRPHHSSWTGANLAKFEGILRFILHTPAKIAASASLPSPQGADQQCNRLGQLLVLLGKNLHSYEDQDHADPRCKGQANNRAEAGDWDLPLITSD